MSECLSAALERFNRKERNLLVRAILGHEEKPLRLTESFRNGVAKELEDFAGIHEDAWWATDYHISWLAGALAVSVKGDPAVYGGTANQLLPPWANPSMLNTEIFKVPPGSGIKLEGNESQLVEGNQEDVDLVIATASELIMIEAKGFDSFAKDQLQSKLQRLELLHTFYQDTLRPTRDSIRFRFLLISPYKPPEFLDISWPCWTRKKDGTVPWIRLHLGERLTVERCDDNHRRSAKGGHWHVIRQ